MQVFAKTLQPLRVEDVKGSLSALERHMGYLQEQTDHVLAQLRRRLGIQGDDQQEAAKSLAERLSDLEGAVRTLQERVDKLEQRVQALETPAQGG